MGTNFYWKRKHKRGDFDDCDKHIGKRSAAGAFCWDCNITLCKQGNAGIHYDASAWYTACPQCGQSAAPQSGFNTAAGVELGFSKPRAGAPEGVHSCSSFTWAQDPEIVRKKCSGLKGSKIGIVDEYGRLLTGRQFLKMLRTNCPVEFTDSIGQQFS